MTFQKIDGKWRGHYTYATNPDGGSSFNAVFEEREGALSGDIVDDEWMGAAVIVGDFSFPDVRFTKQYTTIKASSIDYKGTMSSDGKTMSGNWVIFESELTMRGSWHAYRLDQQKEKRQTKTKAVRYATSAILAMIFLASDIEPFEIELFQVNSLRASLTEVPVLRQ